MQQHSYNGGQRTQDERIAMLEAAAMRHEGEIGWLKGKFTLLVSLQLAQLAGIIGLITVVLGR